MGTFEEKSKLPNFCHVYLQISSFIIIIIIIIIIRGGLRLGPALLSLNLSTVLFNQVSLGRLHQLILK
jgi:hypothetical protein